MGMESEEIKDSVDFFNHLKESVYGCTWPSGFHGEDKTLQVACKQQFEYRTQRDRDSKKLFKFSSLSIWAREMSHAKVMIEACGNFVNRFSLGMCQILKASELVEILNLMPNLKLLEIDTGNVNDLHKIILEESEKTLENSKRIKLGEKLNLPNLKALEINTKVPSIYDFFAEYLPENSIEEFTSEDWRSREYGNCEPELFFEKQKCTKQEWNESIRKFFLKQKSIKKANFTGLEVNLLKLDELSICCSNFNKVEEIILALKSQPQLKVLILLIRDEISEKFLEEVEKHPSIEALKIFDLTYYKRNFSFEWLKFLTKLKLKKLWCFFKIPNFDLDDNPKWTLNRFEHLEQLVLPDNEISSAEVLECFPNLKVLDVKTTLKLNTFAKFLPKLEALKLNYRIEINVCTWEYYSLKFDICELDTGIVHENLKFLRIEARVKNFWETIENIQDIPEVFPNLELYELRFDRRESNRAFERPNPKTILNFFDKFNEMKNLKILKLSKIANEPCQKIYKELGPMFDKLLKKLENFRCDFRHTDNNFPSFPGVVFEAITEPFHVYDERNDEIILSSKENCLDNRLSNCYEEFDEASEEEEDEENWEEFIFDSEKDRIIEDSDYDSDW